MDWRRRLILKTRPPEAALNRTTAMVTGKAGT
jgi:hypothetical protein